MNHQDCRCELLVSSEVGHVTVCQSCDQVHLTLEFMTLRFEAGAFRSLADMLNRAQCRLDRLATTSTAPLPIAAAGGFH